MEDKIQLLKKQDLFKDLDDIQLEAISKSLTSVDFAAREILIEQSDTSNNTYFIISGTVNIYTLSEEGEQTNIAILGPGEVVGELSLIDDEPRSATVQAIQDTETFLLTGEKFHQILRTYPEIAIRLLQTLAKRVRVTNQHLEDQLSKNLPERTWGVLTNLANHFPNKDISLSQEELADIIGATRARVTEVLNDLEKQGKITLSHRKIHLT